LFVTRLRPGTIILEKYLSRLRMVAGFLVLAIPCMTVAYPLGGVTAGARGVIDQTRDPWEMWNDVC
jgi:hypothetical protein